MPLVLVSRSHKISDDYFRGIVGMLPTIIAENLDVPEHPLARLTSDDIEIRVQESPFDIRHHDIEVTIFATKFQARIYTGQIRSDKIALDLQNLLPSGMTGFIYVILADAFFSPF